MKIQTVYTPRNQKIRPSENPDNQNFKNSENQYFRENQTFRKIQKIRTSKKIRLQKIRTSFLDLEFIYKFLHLYFWDFFLDKNWTFEIVCQCGGGQKMTIWWKELFPLSASVTVPMEQHETFSFNTLQWIWQKNEWMEIKFPS